MYIECIIKNKFVMGEGEGRRCNLLEIFKGHLDVMSYTDTYNIIYIDIKENKFFNMFYIWVHFFFYLVILFACRRFMDLCINY